MADTRGVWGLSETWEEKTTDEWVPLPNVFITETPTITKVNTGYIGGGSPSANLDKLNFANDTKTNLGNILPGSPRKSGAVGGNTHGYFGGRHPGYDNFINKIVYATDAGSRIPTTLSAGRGYLAGCNSETNGYFVGGAGSFNSYRSIVDRITHATDTLARIPSADLPSANTKQSNMATTASPSAAYCGGGVSPATTAVSKLTFSTESSAQVPGAAMITARGYASCSSNGTNTYWYAGSSNNNGTAPTSDIDKTVFASDTTSNIPANMPNSYNTRKAATGSDTFGVIAGGTPGGPANLGSAYKFTYSNESVASAPGMNLSSDKREASGSSARNGFTGSTYNGDTTVTRWFDNLVDGPDVGYVTGGYSGTPSWSNKSSTEKINMATDTANAIVPGGQMPISGASMGASFGNHQYGITATLAQAARTWSPGSAWSYCYRFAYSTETFSTIASLGDIPSNYETGGRGYNDPTANMGYYAGGRRSGESSGKSYVYKYSYSGDTWSSSPSLNQGRHWATNAQDNNYAWMLGGKGYNDNGYAPLLTHSEKMSFSDGTWVLQPSTTFANVTAGPQWSTRTHRMTYNACGDETAAYWASGYYWNDTNGCTNVWKLTYATGTIDDSGMYTTPSPTTYDLGGGLSNEPKGYFAGGNWNGATTTVNKFPYSSETISALGTYMTEGRMSAFTFGPRKTGSRLSIPTATPTPSTTLTGPQGIKNEGYLIQGNQGPTGITAPVSSSVSRLDYSTDTWDSSAFANSTLTRRRGGASSTTTNTYIGGGILGSVDGSPTGGDMDKLTYATSTMSRIPGSDAGRITTSRGTDGQPAAGNQNLGYWGGGYGPSGAGRSHVDKFIYSSETASSLPNWPWPQNNLGVAVAMQTHAYLGGGPSETGTNFVKITFANDTYSSKSGWTISSSEKKYSGATSSPSKAYIVGGENMTRQMDVTTWANDTTSSSPSTFLASPGFYMAPGQGGDQAGYFTGGGNTGNNGTTTEKITFATDTSAILPGAYFSSSHPSGVNSYTTGGPNMNGVGNTLPNVI